SLIRAIVYFLAALGEEEGAQIVDVFEVIAADPPHRLSYLRDGVPPARGGEIDARGGGHVRSRLQVVEDEDVLFLEAESLHRAEQGIGMGLSPIGVVVPAEYEVGHNRRARGAIIALDHLRFGMRDDDEQSAEAAMLLVGLEDAGEELGDARGREFPPDVVARRNLVAAEPELFLEEGDESGIEVPLQEVLEADGFRAGAKTAHRLDVSRVMDAGSAHDGGVVVVDDQAAVTCAH